MRSGGRTRRRRRWESHAHHDAHADHRRREAVAQAVEAAQGLCAGQHAAHQRHMRLHAPTRGAVLRQRTTEACACAARGVGGGGGALADEAALARWPVVQLEVRGERGGRAALPQGATAAMPQRHASQIQDHLGQFRSGRGPWAAPLRGARGQSPPRCCWSVLLRMRMARKPSRAASSPCPAPPTCRPARRSETPTRPAAGTARSAFLAVGPYHAHSRVLI